MKNTAPHFRSSAIFLALLTALLLAAPGLCLAAAAPAPAPAAPPPAPVIKPHVLAATEKINVMIEGEPEANRAVTLDEKGEVDLYLIRKIKLGGLTAEQASRAIEKSYLDGLFLRRPKVSITIETQVIQTVMVLGQVKKSGNLILPSDRVVDIVDVIGLADGFNDLAKESGVKVTRIMEDGVTQKTWDNIDVGAYMQGKKARKDALVIQPGDIINVPMRMF